ncbi:hypothetical protein H9Y04_00040 [Streptomyces sp. TRM66268-LWL]|uniref:Uncharacterized protein n=1 Tax=Streptomyces polyasparticus TaxID=2767826 RepID=A0ABR7S8V1_9ACTN|nr:hypothetical protein [Streptomyces polyasparticus]MBC9710966.1 hypothetical protein [Streptomyces polyasparticus]
MYLVTTTVPAEALPGEPSLDDRIRQLALPEDQLEHIHVLPSPDGGAHLTLFLGHPDSKGTEAAAARLVARALPATAESELDWAPATPLVSALEQLGLDSHDGPDDRELPSQDPDTR